MARIGLINDYSEVVVALSHLLTPGHDVTMLHFPAGLQRLEPIEPALDALVAVIFRAKEAWDRPITNFNEDVVGGPMLKGLQRTCDFEKTKLIVFAVGVLPEHVPPGIHFDMFLTFPEAIQEINPLLSGLFGPPPRNKGGA